MSFYTLWPRERARTRLAVLGPDARKAVREVLDRLKSDPFAWPEVPAREGGGRMARVVLDNPGTILIRYDVRAGAREVDVRLIETTLERDERRQRDVRARIKRRSGDVW